MASPHRRILAAIAVLAVTASVALGAPANAERKKYKDAAGDVVSATLDADFETVEEPAPGWTRGDIRATVVNHGRSTVSVTVRTASPMSRGLSAMVVVRSPGGASLALASKMPGLGSEVMFLDAKDPEKDCSGVKVRSGKARTTLTISIPRRCLGNPGWIRAGIGLSTMDPATADVASFEDDGLRTGLSAWGVPKLSKKLKRG